MSESAEGDSMSESERLDMAADQAIAAHDGDPRRMIRSLLLVRGDWRRNSREVSSGASNTDASKCYRVAARDRRLPTRY